MGQEDIDILETNGFVMVCLDMKVPQNQMVYHGLSVYHPFQSFPRIIHKPCILGVSSIFGQRQGNTLEISCVYSWGREAWIRQATGSAIKIEAGQLEHVGEPFPTSCRSSWKSWMLWMSWYCRSWSEEPSETLYRALGLRCVFFIYSPSSVGDGLVLSASIPCWDQGLAQKLKVKDGDYLATVTISGNVDMAEQLINERLREQFHPR